MGIFLGIIEAWKTLDCVTAYTRTVRE